MVLISETWYEFIWSRIRRIVPLYLLFAAPAFAIDVTSTGFSWRDALATFAFWPATDQMTVPALDVGWTLCFEMLFYACSALVLVVCPPWRIWSCIPTPPDRPPQFNFSETR